MTHPFTQVLQQTLIQWTANNPNHEFFQGTIATNLEKFRKLTNLAPKDIVPIVNDAALADMHTRDYRQFRESLRTVRRQASEGRKHKANTITEISFFGGGTDYNSPPTGRRKRKYCGWNMFSREQMTGGARVDIGELGERWKHMSEAERLPYEELASNQNASAITIGRKTGGPWSKPTDSKPRPASATKKQKVAHNATDSEEEEQEEDDEEEEEEEEEGEMACASAEEQQQRQKQAQLLPPLRRRRSVPSAFNIEQCSDVEQLKQHITSLEEIIQAKMAELQRANVRIGQLSCSQEGCDTKLGQVSFCKKHKKRCSHEGCNNVARSGLGGMCMRHNQNKPAYYYCKVDNCTKKSQYKGLCANHGGVKGKNEDATCEEMVDV